MSAIWNSDNPWARLPWVGPVAVAVAFAALLGFIRLTLEQPPLPAPPRPVIVSMLELPPPPASQPTVSPIPQPEPAKPAEVSPPEPKPIEVPPPPKPVKVVKIKPKPVKPPPEKPVIPPPINNPPPEPVPESAPPVKAETPPPAPATPASPPAAEHQLGGGNMSARAIYKPMPEIPDELRQRNLNLVAVARFHVGVDGTADVELVEATPVLQLNQVLLATLKKWRFFPALQDGKPIASAVDIRIPITVQ